MKRFLFISVVFSLTVLCVVCDVHNLDEHDESLDSQWEKFKKTFNKKFTENENEEAKRRLVFKKNLAYITDHNQRAHLGEFSYHLGINHFSDMTPDEKKAYMTSSEDDAANQYDKVEGYKVSQNNAPIPDTLDWRDRGIISKPKDQGTCAASWAFSYIGALEAQYAMEKHREVSLSEQQLIDCADESDRNGCQGGSMYIAMNYANENGIEMTFWYQYVGQRQRCRFQESKVAIKPKAKLMTCGRNDLCVKNVVAMNGPVAVYIQTCPAPFLSYSHGLYDHPNCGESQTYHHLLIVGYGDGYWLAKNSFGTDWGENGYIYMKRNEDNESDIGSFMVVI